jgi:hypothetical protein
MAKGDENRAQRQLTDQERGQHDLWYQNYQQYQNPYGNNTPYRTDPSRPQSSNPQSGGGGRPPDFVQLSQGLDPRSPDFMQQVQQRARQAGYSDATVANRGRSGRRGLSSDKIIIGGQMYDIVRGVDGSNPTIINPRPINAPGTDPYGAPGGGNSLTGPNFGQGLLSPGLSGYHDFATTGGFSEQDKANYRARAIAPTRAIYSLAQDELKRARNLSGGYMPNFAPAQAKMAREMAYTIGDQNVNAEASLADAVRSGRLAGLQGYSQLGSEIGRQGLQAQQLGLGLSQAQVNKSQVPGNFDVGLGRVGSIAGMVSPFISPFGGGGGGTQPQLPGLVQSPYYGM